MNTKASIVFSAGVVLILVVAFIAIDYFTGISGYFTGKESISQHAINKILEPKTNSSDGGFNMDCIHGSTNPNKACPET